MPLNVSSAIQTCIKNSNYSFVVFEATLTSGNVNLYAQQNLLNSKAAGLNADIQVDLCRSKNASEIVDAVMKSIDANLYDKVYLKVY